MEQVCCALAGTGARANSGGVCVCWVCRAVKRHRGRVEKRGSVPDAALSQEARPSSTDLGPSEVADAEAED